MIERDDRLTLLLRAPFTLLAVFTAIFGPALLLFPGSTEDFWSWQIRPDMSAVWVGAGYTFGALAISTMLVLGRWSASVVAIVGTFPFALAMLGATLIHRDRFFDDTLRFYIWFAIYLGLPVLLPPIFVWNRRRDPGIQPSDLLLPPPLRAVLIGAGSIAFLLGVWLFFDPDGLASSWPWLLTPLMSRVIGGWLMFIGAGGLAASFEPRYAAYRFFLPPATAWFMILLVASLFNTSDFDAERLSTYLYFGAVSGTIVFLGGLFIYMERQLRVHKVTAPEPIPAY